MGSDLQCSLIAFLAVVNIFDVLIFSVALLHTLAASHIKLFFALVDLPASVRSPGVILLASMAFSCLSLVFIFDCGSSPCNRFYRVHPTKEGYQLK